MNIEFATRELGQPAMTLAQDGQKAVTFPLASGGFLSLYGPDLPAVLNRALDLISPVEEMGENVPNGQAMPAPREQPKPPKPQIVSPPEISPEQAREVVQGELMVLNVPKGPDGHPIQLVINRDGEGLPVNETAMRVYGGVYSKPIYGNVIVLEGPAMWSVPLTLEANQQKVAE